MLFFFFFFFFSKTPITCNIHVNCKSKFLCGSEVFRVMCISRMCCATDELQLFVSYSHPFEIPRKMCTADVLLRFIPQIYYFSKAEHVSLIYCHTSNQYLQISVATVTSFANSVTLMLNVCSWDWFLGVAHRGYLMAGCIYSFTRV